MPPLFISPLAGDLLCLAVCYIYYCKGVIIMKNNYEQHGHTTELVYSCCTYRVKN